MEPKRLGRPPKHPGERTARTTVALTEGDLARLDAIPGATRADRIRGLLDANLQVRAELQAQVDRYCADVPAPVGQDDEDLHSVALDMISAPPG